MIRVDRAITAESIRKREAEQGLNPVIGPSSNASNQSQSTANNSQSATQSGTVSDFAGMVSLNESGSFIQKSTVVLIVGTVALLVVGIIAWRFSQSN